MEKSKKIRKNVVLSVEADRDLRIIAKTLKISQSKVIEDLIKEKIKEFKIKEKLESLKKIKGILKGDLKGKKIQDLKSEKA